MAMFQSIAFVWAAPIGIVFASLSSPAEAQVPPVLRLCGFDQSFGDGADTTYPRRNESRVQIDLQRGRRAQAQGNGGKGRDEGHGRRSCKRAGASGSAGSSGRKMRLTGRQVIELR